MPEPRIQPRPLLLIGVIALVAFAGGVYLALTTQSRGTPSITGLLWPDPPVLGHFELTSMTGTPLTEQALRGHWTLVFFGFTHCPDVCPTTLASLKTVVATLHDFTPFAAHHQVLFISVDPARDHAAQLKQYVTYFDPSFIAATGEAAALDNATHQFGVIYTKVATADPRNYTVDHTASLFLVDPTLKLVGVFSPPHDAADISRRIRGIVEFVSQQAP